MSIAVLGITKRFGSFAALNDVTHHFASGELVALLGPSGSGKTSLLRIIAGLETPDAGQVLFENEDATDRHARRRGVGFVFQHYALFRHMTVFENIAFGLRVKPRRSRPSRDEIRERVDRLLKLVQLDWLGGRMPSELSGGQRQRVALARALAVEPKVLLLDEPFGALDGHVRKELRRWLRRLHDEIHVTSVFVTHDVEEAMEVADQIVVMNEGRIVQTGTPEDVYDRPATPFVYTFLGSANVIHPSDPLAMEWRAVSNAVDPGIPVFARPHDVEVFIDGPHAGAVRAVVVAVRSVGSISRLDLRQVENGRPLEVEVDKSTVRALNLAVGASVFVRLRTVKAYPGGVETTPDPARDRRVAVG